MINRRSVFSDETEEFKTPYEPDRGDKVTILFRTLANDVLKAYAVVNGKKIAMKKVKSEGYFDYYEAAFICPEERVRYHFTAEDEDDYLCFNRLGCADVADEEYDFSFDPGFTVPEWARGALFYQIFPDRFCNGNELNDVCDNEYYYTGGHVRRITDWDKFPDTLDVNNFYGGDLQGVWNKLDYIRSLGVNAIYFNPLFVSPSNHKYDTQDYDHVDPHLSVIAEDGGHPMQDWEKHNGYAPKYIKRVTDKTNLEKSNEFFARLVEEIHARGMRVVIDGVFNHCGSFNKWMDREGIYLGKKGFRLGAYQSVESPYRNWFRFDEEDKAHSDYEGWWGFQTLPKLNYEGSSELADYVAGIGAKWVSAPYRVDGWRLDVAADLGHSEAFNHKFWQRFRKSVRDANPQALILSEHYGSPAPWLNGKEWDSVMNYDAFMEPVTWFLTGMEKHSREFDAEKLGDGNYFFESMARNMAKLPRPSLDSALNQLSNHDHSRFLTRTNGKTGTLAENGPYGAAEGVDKAVMALGVLIQMTWPGSPGIYYGDEAGQVGWTDPDSRRTYPWGKEDGALIELHRCFAALRQSVHCLRLGSIKELYAGQGSIAYGRFDGTDCAVAVVNRSEEEVCLSIPVWELGVRSGEKMKEELVVQGGGAVRGSGESQIVFGRLRVQLGAKSGCIYSYRFVNEDRAGISRGEQI